MNWLIRVSLGKRRVNYPNPISSLLRLPSGATDLFKSSLKNALLIMFVSRFDIAI
jgi:hypothetical protein